MLLKSKVCDKAKSFSFTSATSKAYSIYNINPVSLSGTFLFQSLLYVLHVIP